MLRHRGPLVLYQCDPRSHHIAMVPVLQGGIVKSVIGINSETGVDVSHLLFVLEVLRRRITHIRRLLAHLHSNTSQANQLGSMRLVLIKVHSCRLCFLCMYFSVDLLVVQPSFLQFFFFCPASESAVGDPA